MPDRWPVWLLVLGIGAANFLLRYAFLLIFGRGSVPGPVREVLPFIPAAALAAIVAPQAFAEPLAGHLLGPRLLAWLGAMLVAWRTRNMPLTIAGGLALLWVLQAVLPAGA